MVSVLSFCAPFCARSFEGDAIGPDVARPGVGEGATVGDCEAREFFLLRDRCRPGEPWREDLEEANWKARGDAFLASLVRIGDVVNMVMQVHGRARGGRWVGCEGKPTRGGGGRSGI